MTPEEIKAEYPGGTRIRLIGTSDRYTNLRAGEAGTVQFVDSVGTVHVLWDSGSRLGMIVGEDRFYKEQSPTVWTVRVGHGDVGTVKNLSYATALREAKRLYGPQARIRGT